MLRNNSDLSEPQKQAAGDRQEGIDWFRILASLLVIAIHTSPLASYSQQADFFLTRVLARIAVPFFFMVTGQFVLRGLFEIGPVSGSRNAGTGAVRKYLKKIILLYLIAVILYLPLGIYAGHYKGIGFTEIMKMLFFDGTFYHLWYFPACIIGVSLIWGLSAFLSYESICKLSVILYILALLGDSYYGLAAKVPFLSHIYDISFKISAYTRNGLLFAPIFLMLGAGIDKWKKKIKGRYVMYGGLLVSFDLMTAEAFLVRRLGWQRHDSMYVSLVPVMLFLYVLLQGQDKKNGKRIHKIKAVRIPAVTTWVYILHPAVIVAVRLFAKLLKLDHIFVKQSLIHYILVAAISFLSALVIGEIQFKCRKPFPVQSYSGRAWIEISRKALANNVAFLQSRLPENCKLMPAIKANAYGHGADLVAKELEGMGVESFCVAGVMEAVSLRKQGITGELLVLGYTHPSQFQLLEKYKLIQTAVDYEYAKELNSYGKPLHIHIGVDTGMHRLGERSENIDALCEIFEMENLVVDGMFTHLSADDVMGPEEEKFTHAQVESFYQVVREIEERGYTCPKLHLQSSYGVLNYPELAEDYARVGIALYGVLSTDADTRKWRTYLQPVLSLRTRVVTVRDLYEGESAGYGLSFIADKDMRIAALALGYADGLPRTLSGGKGYVLIHGKKAPIIGLICMDQVIVDITDIPETAEGDVVTVIGENNGEEILASDIAKSCGTITNEILSRLGQRLERIVV